MKKLSLLSFALIILIGSISIISGPGCANIIPPQGGFRDSIPPLLVKASPPDSTKNFKDKRFTLTFDEFLAQLDNVRENLVISPVPQNFPEVEVKLRTVIVRLKDS